MQSLSLVAAFRGERRGKHGGKHGMISSLFCWHIISIVSTAVVRSTAAWTWSNAYKKRNTWICIADWFIKEIHMNQSYFNLMYFSLWQLVQQEPSNGCASRRRALQWRHWPYHRSQGVRLLSSNTFKATNIAIDVMVLHSDEVDWGWMKSNEIGGGWMRRSDDRSPRQLNSLFSWCCARDVILSAAGHVQSGIST